MTVAGAESKDLQSHPGRETVQITPCPKSPNCVSSLARDPGHRLEPLLHDAEDSDALARLRRIIEAMPRTKIVQATPEYLRAEFKSSIFGFVDDLELVVGEVPGVIHVRSASRVGYWDFGVNRRRVELIRRKLTGAWEG